jgi:hypothetical protein
MLPMPDHYAGYPGSGGWIFLLTRRENLNVLADLPVYAARIYCICWLAKLAGYACYAGWTSWLDMLAVHSLLPGYTPCLF